MRAILTQYGRPDLYEAYTATHGLHGATPDYVAQRLREGAEAFDLAVTVRRSPHPFQHKLYPHLRPYLVESCRSLIAEGRIVLRDRMTGGCRIRRATAPSAA